MRDWDEIRVDNKKEETITFVKDIQYKDGAEGRAIATLYFVNGKLVSIKLSSMLFNDASEIQAMYDVLGKVILELSRRGLTDNDIPF